MLSSLCVLIFDGIDDQFALKNSHVLTAAIFFFTDTPPSGYGKTMMHHGYDNIRRSAILISFRPPAEKPMKNFAVVFSTIFLLAGCSSTAEKPPKRTESEFMGGGITLVYSSKGVLTGIVSTATAPVIGNLPSSIDLAVSVATLKARRQIAEFIQVEVSSDRFMTTVSKDLQQSDNVNDTENQQVTTEIVNQLRDNIRQRSNQIMRGTVVEKEDFNSMTKTVTVTVSAGEKQSDSARALRGMVTR